MILKKTFLWILVMSFIACSPKVTTKLDKKLPALNIDEDVIVIAIYEESPTDAIEIGTIKIGDAGFTTNCDSDLVINKAKLIAKKAGGNVLKIIEHIPAGKDGSSCDRITAKILKVKNPLEVKHIKPSNIIIVDSTWNYAKIYVYRHCQIGALFPFKIHLGDSVICNIKNNSKREIWITRSGMNTLWAETESKCEIPINFVYGQEYYLKCEMSIGVVLFHPHIVIMDRLQGKLEYNSDKLKN